ncbi:MAG: asparagine synthetase B, partial [Oscillospiraceae bacterium]|nr:asparagine synthetase B [Oscillospiraceae bacterium]
MVTNGEIFNFKELREELISKGHKFKTGTDVEVILHLYEEYGLDFPNKLNGQYAIALLDSEKDELILVRDPIGIAPLFYTEFDGRVIFASEIKAILEYPGVPRKLNMHAVDQLMNFPGIVSPTTFFEGIYSLRAGHMLRIRRNSSPEDIEYWDLKYPTEEPEDKGEAYYVERLRELLKKS